MKFKPYRSLTLADFSSANVQVVTSVDIACKPEDIFDMIAGDEIWTRWAPGLKKVDWTSSAPYGQGSTRTVHLVGGMAVKEVFFLWEEYKACAFYVGEGTLPAMDAFGEYYQVEQLNNGSIRLTWTVVMNLTGLNKIMVPMYKIFMKPVLSSWLKRLKVIMESEY